MPSMPSSTIVSERAGRRLEQGWTGQAAGGAHQSSLIPRIDMLHEGSPVAPACGAREGDQPEGGRIHMGSIVRCRRGAQHRDAGCDVRSVGWGRSPPRRHQDLMSDVDAALLLPAVIRGMLISCVLDETQRLTRGISRTLPPTTMISERRDVAMPTVRPSAEPADEVHAVLRRVRRRGPRRDRTARDR